MELQKLENDSLFRFFVDEINKCETIEELEKITLQLKENIQNVKIEIFEELENRLCIIINQALSIQTIQNCYECKYCYYENNNFLYPACKKGFYLVSNGEARDFNWSNAWVGRAFYEDRCPHFKYSLLHFMYRAIEKGLLK